MVVVTHPLFWRDNLSRYSTGKLGYGHILSATGNSDQQSTPIAHELKGQIFSLLEQGYKRDEILDFMVQRYGEKIRYQPELKPSTLALWLGPLALLIIGLGLGLSLIKRKSPSANNATRSV